MYQQGFLHIRCTTDGALAGGWYGAVANAYLVDQPNVPWPIPPQSVQLNSFIQQPIYGWSQSSTALPADWTINLDNAGGDDFFEQAFMTTTGASPNAVQGFLAPLYTIPFNQTITQNLEDNATFPWLRDDASRAYNGDALVQEAVWRRVEPQVGSMTKSEFFDGPWQRYLDAGVHLAMTLISVRGPDLPAGQGTIVGGGPAPGLVGFPSEVPAYGISNESKVKFGGVGSEILERFQYYKETVNGASQMYPAAAGAALTLASAGFKPKMQIRLWEQGTTVNYRINVFWAAFGHTVFRVPQAAAAGTHIVKEFRYYRGLVGNTPTYGPWRTIPAGNRPNVVVQ